MFNIGGRKATGSRYCGNSKSSNKFCLFYYIYYIHTLYKALTLKMTPATYFAFLTTLNFKS